MKTFPLLAIIILTIGLGITSCTKSERDNDISTFATEDHLLAERLSNDILQIVDEAARTTQGIKSLTCAVITADTLSSPKVLTIDYNQNTPCTDDDGLERRGIITATFTGHYLDSATSVTITTAGMRIGNRIISMTANVTNLGENSDGNPHFFVVISNFAVEDPTNQWDYTWQANTVRVQTAGAATEADVSDDTYSITGSGSGVNRVGNTFSHNITEAITLSANCDYVSAGKAEVWPANLSTRKLDYGSACDAIVSVSINDDVVEVAVD